MTRKIIKIGDSAGITLPKDLLKKHGLKIGGRVELREVDGKVTIENPQSEQVDRELLDWTDKFIDTHRAALEELADK
jgi:putative addiction module antidote